MLLIILGSLVLIIVIYACFINRIKGLPSGPPPLPFIGNIYLFKGDLLDVFEGWKKKYGDVFTVWMPRPVIFLTTKETLQDALINQAEAFSGRPLGMEAMKMVYGGRYGLVFEDNAIWKDQRRFALHTLRELGFRSEGLQDAIVSLAAEVVERMKEEEGKEVELRPFFMFAVSNVIWHLTFGRMLKFGDPLFYEVKKDLDEIMELIVHPGMLLIELNPKLVILDPLLGSPMKRQLTANDRMIKILNNEIDQIEASLEMDSPPKSYVEAFLQEMKRNELAGKDAGSFTRHQMLFASYDMWAAGFETTVSTLRYAFFHLMTHPRVQEKMQEEIKREIGGRAIRMEDQKVLPYCCAVIQEVQRITVFSAINVSHCTVAEAQVAGYSLPVGTDVMPELQLVHMDENEFERPKYFCPERHINENGEFVKDPRIIPFSMGKRSCLGESLARTELFIFLCTFIQHFNFKFPGLIPPELKEREAFVRSPHPYKAVIVPRLQ